MARAVKKIPWTNLALVAALGFAWTKLGLSTAVKDIDPTQIVGVVKPVNGRCPAGWTKFGNRCIKL